MLGLSNLLNHVNCVIKNTLQSLQHAAQCKDARSSPLTVRLKSGVRVEVFDNGFRLDLTDKETLNQLRKTIRKIDENFYIKDGSLYRKGSNTRVDID